MRSYDAVIIGAGPNGLVAGNVLADAGWRVLVLEAQHRIGGAVASDSDVQDGYIHDTFSSFYPLAAASPVLTAMNLDRFGLTWSHAPAVVGSPDRNGGWALIHHDPRDTAEGLERLHAGDGDAWERMYTDWTHIGGALVDALLSPFPPLRAGLRAAFKLRKVGSLSFIRMLLEPSRTLAGTRLRGTAAQLLIAGNAAHADIPPDAAGSGLFGWLLAMLAQDVGFPVAQGGAAHLAAALGARFTGLGGDIRCNAEVTRIEVDHGRAVGVRLTDGEIIPVRRAVIADVSAPALYGQLVGWEQLPARVHRQMRSFQWDPGTVKVDWALNGPVPWHDSPPTAPGTVHLTGSIDDLSQWMTHINSGLVPADPFLLIGQMTTADPTRSPPGTEALWAYTHVPQHVRGDAGGQHITGHWSHTDAQRIADRMQGKIERAAPGFTDRILARRILTPPDLYNRDANLVGGALNAGTAALHQQLIFRPIPGLGRAGTPIRGLYLGSAAAHPGGGVHGACGANAARAALAHDRLHPLTR
ncbi:phytoene desaturase family protein [Nakamurella multipartita]|uniref:Pyridine nucleotide-disulfide oxidoreductase domain-containing protein 2 n=1 Tax=Nakamurella multipartita (strain ATCC 700099 / DSM 44233 / CIP 104796 / JCM 9543 / NBRC 105858 / Y-104) TaxID=479431 RepID=C8XFM5_NAKMY|nr:NAD(P)/FAD-dependent oxidoreductase [Nakamurella multipartita]ACV80002.1 FAD dependent oxidoreductase [Nakamurella multipartita DSM 44233]